ncbi:MAG: hypothetical protein ACE5KG_06600, partial [Nitrososphaerales archaeon]
ARLLSTLAFPSSSKRFVRNVAEAVKHIRLIDLDIARTRVFFEREEFQELQRLAHRLNVSFELLQETAMLGRLPVVNFAAGGITTPADAALMLNLGCDGIFVGSGIFKSDDPLERARSIVLSATFPDRPEIVVDAQKMIDEGKSMLGLDTSNLELRMQDRGKI